MDNDELLIVIKDMFEKTVSDIKKGVKGEIAEVKNHMGTLVEKLEGDIKTVAESHSDLNKKIDKLQIDLNETREEIKSIKKDMTIVKDYVIGVDKKLNEHDVILKRVK